MSKLPSKNLHLQKSAKDFKALILAYKKHTGLALLIFFFYRGETGRMSSSTDSCSGGTSADAENRSSDSGSMDDPRETISILGSGDFGRALAGRLVKAGFNVIIGSRDPERNA